MSGCNCGSTGGDYAVRSNNPDGTYTITNVVKDVMGGTVEYATKELQKSRLALCQDCEHLLSNIVRLCKKCGCIVAVKVQFSKSICPVSKW